MFVSIGANKFIFILSLFIFEKPNVTGHNMINRVS